MPAPGERAGQFGDVDVLAAGVDTTDGRQRIRVLGNEIDLHCVSSLTALTTCSLVT